MVLSWESLPAANDADSEGADRTLAQLWITWFPQITWHLSPVGRQPYSQ